MQNSIQSLHNLIELNENFSKGFTKIKPQDYEEFLAFEILLKSAKIVVGLICVVFCCYRTTG